MKNWKLALMVALAICMIAVPCLAEKKKAKVIEPQTGQFNWDAEAAKPAQGYSPQGLAAIGQGSTKCNVELAGGKLRVTLSNIWGNPADRGFFTPDKWVRAEKIDVFAGGPDAAGNAKVGTVSVVDNTAVIEIDDPTAYVKANPGEFGLAPNEPFKLREQMWFRV